MGSAGDRKAANMYVLLCILSASPRSSCSGYAKCTKRLRRTTQSTSDPIQMAKSTDAGCLELGQTSKTSSSSRSLFLGPETGRTHRWTRTPMLRGVSTPCTELTAVREEGESEENGEKKAITADEGDLLYEAGICEQSLGRDGPVLSLLLGPAQWLNVSRSTFHVETRLTLGSPAAMTATYTLQMPSRWWRGVEHAPSHGRQASRTA